MDLGLETLSRRLYGSNRKRILAQVEGGRFRPGRRTLTLAAAALALLPLGLSMVLGAWAVISLLSSRNLYVSLALSLPLLVLAILSLPRLARPRKDTVYIPRNGHEDLFARIDLLSKKLSGGRIDEIGFCPDFNASYSSYGLGQRRAIVLGIPLLHALEPLEAHWVLCHELVHSGTRDPRRQPVINAGLDCLEHWKNMMLDARASLPAILAPLLLGPAGLIFLYQTLILLLVWRESQECEFWADIKALEASGKEEARMALKVLLYGDVLKECLDEALLRKVDFAAHYRNRCRELIQARLDNFEARASGEGEGFVSTHPMSLDRIAAIGKASPGGNFMVGLTEDILRLAESHSKDILGGIAYEYDAKRAI